MFLLKAQWALLGLKAPAFSWLVSGAILVYCMCVYLRHRRGSRYQTHAIFVAEKKLASLRDNNLTDPGNGVPRKLYDSIADVFNGLPLLRFPWQRISSSIIRRPDKSGQIRFWAGEDMARIFDEVITDSHAYKTAPAVITGIGLLATFVAILVALLDVKLANNRVQGLDLLVQGLSGKFLSSIVALACATLLVYAEKGILYPVRARINSLVFVLTSLLPRLLPAQLLSDLCIEMTEQSNTLRAFNTDLPSKLKQSIAEGAGQSLDKIVAILGDLNHFIRKNEAQRYEANNEQFTLLLKHLERSRESSPQTMGERFNDPPVDPATGQPAHIAESFANSATLLEQMSNQFSRNQDALNDLIGVVKDATTNQTAVREARDEQLAGMLNQLIGGLQRQTGESMGSMEKALAAITVDISNKVMDLSAQVAATLEKTTEKSTRNVKEALDEVGSLSSQSIHRLVQLMEVHGAGLSGAKDLTTSLYGIAKDLSVSVVGQAKTTEALQKLATEVNMGVISLSQIAKSIRETQELAVYASSSASGQIESLNDFIRSQQLVWGRIQASMVQYENVFGKVEGHATDLLTQIAHHLAGYSDTTQKHFVQLTSAADNFISQATGRLSGSIDELSEQLDELHSAVAGITRVSQAVG